MRKFTSADELFEDMKKNHSPWDKFILNPKNEWFRWLIYNTKDVPNDLYRKCKRGWQRAYRGWAKEDVWNLDGYLSKVIRDSIQRLRNRHCGHPPNMTSEEWNKKLDNIIYTFDVNDKILNNYWLALQKYNEWKEKIYLEQKEEYCDFHVMTFKETEKYEIGWNLFKQHYFDLWD